MEKAFAKVFGNFVHVNGGQPNVAVNTLNGGPSTRLEHYLDPHEEGPGSDPMQGPALNFTLSTA